MSNADGQFRIRIGKITLKRGGSVELLRVPVSLDRKRVEMQFRILLNNHGEDIAGFAIVVWGSDLGSTAVSLLTPVNTIPSMLVPDFVRNRLLAQKIEEWTLDSVNEQWGGYK
jgi:hypothetical protein